MERGFDICGIDLSCEMLEKLKQKAPDAKIVQADILEYSSSEKYDYIFISSGSVSLFTDITLCKKILAKLKEMLAPAGKSLCLLSIPLLIDVRTIAITKLLFP